MCRSRSRKTKLILQKRLPYKSIWLKRWRANVNLQFVFHMRLWPVIFVSSMRDQWHFKNVICVTKNLAFTWPVVTRPIFPAVRKVEVSLASHAGVFRGARFWDEKRAPLKTPAWEAKVSLKAVKYIYKKPKQRACKSHTYSYPLWTVSCVWVIKSNFLKLWKIMLFSILQMSSVFKTFSRYGCLIVAQIKSICDCLCPARLTRIMKVSLKNVKHRRSIFVVSQ